MSSMHSPEVMRSAGRVFHTLDALRGLAAIGVVMFHARTFVPGGYLAVDLFFMMSGFVIARAYDERFRTGMSAWEFMRIRLIRLYPLYLLGTVLGLCQVTTSLLGNNSDHWTGPILSVMSVFAVIMLPNFAGQLQGMAEWAQHNTLFPLDIPCWSLFLEIAVNLGFGLLWRQLTVRRLVIVCVCSGVGVVIALQEWGGLDVGFTVPTLIPGMLRTAFGFSMGVLIARQSSVTAPQKNTTLFLAICAAFTIAVAGAPANRIYWDAVSAMLLFPAIVYAATLVEPPAWLRPAASFLGLTSYALYVLNQPLMSVANSAFRARLATQSPIYLGLSLLAALLVSWLVDKYYDLPIRRMLSSARRSNSKHKRGPCK